MSHYPTKFNQHKKDESHGVKETISNYPQLNQKNQMINPPQTQQGFSANPEHTHTHHHQQTRPLHAQHDILLKPQELPIQPQKPELWVKQPEKSIPQSQGFSSASQEFSSQGISSRPPVDIKQFLPENQPESFTYGEKENIKSKYDLPLEKGFENLEISGNKSFDLPKVEQPKLERTEEKVEEKPLLNEPLLEKTETRRTEEETTNLAEGEGLLKVTEEEKIKSEEELKQRFNDFIEKTKHLLYEVEQKIVSKYAEARETLSNIHFDETKAQLSHAYDVTKDKMSHYAEVIMNNTKEELALVKAAIEYAYVNMKEGLNTITGKVGETTMHSLDVAKEKLGELGQKIPEGYEFTKEKLAEGYDVSKEKIGHGYEVGKEKIVEGFDATKEKIGQGYEFTKELVLEAGHKAMEMFEATKDKVVHVGEEIVGKTKEFLKPATDTLEEVADKVRDELTDVNLQRDILKEEKTTEVRDVPVVTEVPVKTIDLPVRTDVFVTKDVPLTKSTDIRKKYD